MKDDFIRCCVVSVCCILSAVICFYNVYSLMGIK